MRAREKGTWEGPYPYARKRERSGRERAVSTDGEEYAPRSVGAVCAIPFFCFSSFSLSLFFAFSVLEDRVRTLPLPVRLNALTTLLTS